MRVRSFWRSSSSSSSRPSSECSSLALRRAFSSARAATRARSSLASRSTLSASRSLAWLRASDSRCSVVSVSAFFSSVSARLPASSDARCAAASSASSCAMRVSALLRESPSLAALSLAFSRLVLRSESSCAEAAAAFSALASWSSSEAILSAWEAAAVEACVSCACRLETSSSSDSMVLDFEASCDARSSLEGEALETRRFLLD